MILEENPIKIDSAIVKHFIDRGAQLDCVTSPAKFTILTLAIAYQHFDIAKLVIEKQLDTLLILLEMEQFFLFFLNIIFLRLTTFLNGCLKST